MTTKAQLQEQLDAALAANEETVKRYEAREKKIVKIAMKAADIHGWCGVASRIISDAGLARHRSNVFMLQGRTGTRWSKKISVEQLPCADCTLESIIDSYGDAERLITRLEQYRARVVEVDGDGDIVRALSNEDIRTMGEKMENAKKRRRGRR